MMEKATRESLFTGSCDLIARTESALQWIHFQQEQKLLYRPKVILKWLNSITLHPKMTANSVKHS